MDKELKKEEAEIKAHEAIAAVEKKFAEAKKSMHDQIRQEPEKAVLVAAAVGAAIGAVTMLALVKSKEH